MGCGISSSTFPIRWLLNPLPIQVVPSPRPFTRWLSVYTEADKTLRLTSPLGRVSSVTLDEKGRPLSWQAPGVLATHATTRAGG